MSRDKSAQHPSCTACCAILLALAFAVGGVLEAAAGQARRPSKWQERAQRSAAKSENRVAAKSEQQTAAPEDSRVRLTYFNATWPKILEHVAESTGSTLVMQSAPKGRRTRRDLKKYSRTEAVRILNRELEPKGYRILERGDFLVVLDLDQVRKRYRRPVVPDRSRADVQQKTSNTTPQQARIEQPNVSRNQKSDSQSDSQPDILPSGPSAVEHTSFQEQSASQNSGEIPRSPEPPALATVKTRRGRATEVARMIYRAFEAQADLIQNGPRGLPAFRVARTELTTSNHPLGKGKAADAPATAPALFTIGFDASRDELLIEAPKERIESLKSLVRQVDSPDVVKGSTVRLFQSEKDLGTLARNLRPALGRMASRQQRPLTGSRLSSVVVAQAEPQNAPPAQEGGQPQTGISLPSSGIGRVQIQDIPGIGLVITGPEEAVEAVNRLIEQIVELSVAAMASIELRPLKHVNSEALAELLTDVYEQLTGLRFSGEAAQQRKTVAVIPVVKPNAVLILAPKAELEPILDLIDKLDQPVDPAMQFEVFPLKSAIASQVVTLLETFYQEPTGLQTRIRAIADARTNTLVVQARPRDLEEVRLLIDKFDRDEPGSINRLKIFPLKHAIAEDLAEVVSQAIQAVLNPAAPPGQQAGQAAFTGAAGAGQNFQQLREVKSMALEFLTTDAEAQRIIRSGILADIRITADPRTNSLVVTAPQQSMQLMAELIQQLDQPTTTVAEIKVFPLENADAATTAQLLEALFQSEQQDDGALGFQVAGAEDVTSGLIPVRFQVDVRTNNIIALGGADALEVVEALILVLDASDVRQRKTEVIRLKNSSVEDVATAINAFMQSLRDLAQIDTDAVSNVELLEREIIAVPEPTTNNLLISATPRYFNEIREIIAELDKAPTQVMIQALIVEVELDNTDEFGVEFGIQDSMLFDRGLLNLDNFRTIETTIFDPISGFSTTTEQIVNQEAVPGFLFNNPNIPLGNNTAVNPSSVGSQGISNFNLGQINGDLGFGGLVVQASSESISMLIRALSAQRRIEILSRPQISAVDNIPASIVVGQVVPIVTSVTPGQVGVPAQPQLDQEDVGIILEVTPRITPDGSIVMEVLANKSSLTGEGVPVFVDGATGNSIDSPIRNTSEVRTTVSVTDGQTIVLGGMITKTDDTVTRKVPWLGDIPVLGTPFRFDSHSTRRTELLVFLTPRIIHSDADSELIKQVELERLNFLEEEAEEVHGPLLSVPLEAESGEWEESLESEAEFAPAPPMTEDGIPTTQVPYGQLMFPVPDSGENNGWFEETGNPSFPTSVQDSVGPSQPITRKPSSRRSARKSGRSAKRSLRSIFKPLQILRK